MNTLYYPNSLKKEQNYSNPSHVMKWGKGKELTIVYTIEHTKHDNELEEINYSNLHKEECYSLDEFMQRLNYFQSQGYKNISVSTQVQQSENIEGLNHNTLIEDISNDIDITINSSHIQETKKENKRLKNNNESQKEEIEIYDSFIKRYNSQKLFESYIDEYDTNKHGNKDANNLYWYSYRLRGFSLGCQPKGHVEVNHNIGRHGIIAYNRSLTDIELSDYELDPYKGKTA